MKRKNAKRPSKPAKAKRTPKLAEPPKVFAKQKWTKEELVREDWDFLPPTVPPEVPIGMLWEHELRRELVGDFRGRSYAGNTGSGTPPRLLSGHDCPFILSEFAKLTMPTWIKNPNWAKLGPMQTFGLRTLTQGFAKEISEEVAPNDPHFVPVLSLSPRGATVHAFRIDWGQTETELVESFTQWLRAIERHPGYSCRKPEKGRRFDGRAFLKKLGAYRLHCAGYTQDEVFAKLHLSLTTENWLALLREIRSAILIAWEVLTTKATTITDASGRPWTAFFKKRFLSKKYPD